MHGFLWLKDAPNIEKLNWNDSTQVRLAKEYFDRATHAFNPRNEYQRIIHIQQNDDDHCLKNTERIFQFDVMMDYEELLNCVEHHIT